LAPSFDQHTSNFPIGSSSLGTTRSNMYIPQSTLVASTLITLLILTNVENFQKISILFFKSQHFVKEVK
jgi:hypothetical protein